MPLLDRFCKSRSPQSPNMPEMRLQAATFRIICSFLGPPSQIGAGDPDMLSHARIWAAVDRLAEKYGLSASGLARKAGLDPTSFNRSKRTSPEGRDRWPSTESVAKILRATGASVEDFLRLV